MDSVKTAWQKEAEVRRCNELWKNKQVIEMFKRHETFYFTLEDGAMGIVNTTNVDFTKKEICIPMRCYKDRSFLLGVTCRVNTLCLKRDEYNQYVITNPSDDGWFSLIRTYE